MAELGPIPRPSPEKKRRWIARWFIGVVLLTAIAWFGGRHLFLNHKISLKTPTRQSAGFTIAVDPMKALYPDVPDDQNAAVALGKAFAEFVTADTNDVNLPVAGKGKLPAHGSPVPDEMLGAIRNHVISNQSAWETTREAIKRPRCRFPIDHDISPETLLPHLPKIKELVQLGHLRVTYFTAIDRIDDATESVATILGVCELIGKEPLLISYLVKLSAQAEICVSVEWMMNLRQLSQGQLVSLQTAFLTVSGADDLEKALMTELDSNLKILKKTTGPSSQDCLFFQTEMGNLIEAAREPFPIRLDKAEGVGLRVQRAQAVGNPKAVPVLSGMVLPGLARAFVKEAESAALGLVQK